MSKNDKSIRFEHGFNWKSALAILYSAFIFLPVVTYLYLLSGQILTSAAIYITVLLFTEISRIFRLPLRKQEVFIIYSLVGAAAYNITFLEMVYRSYFIHSPVARGFTDPFTGLPLPEVVPPFWAPTSTSDAYMARSFLHPDWILPISIAAIYAVLWVCEELAITFITASLFIVEEKLPFPFAQVDASVITALTEREPSRMRVFTISALISMFYAIFLYGIPTISTGIFGVKAEIIPIPWIDLNWLMERILPGSSFGIATDILVIVAGFIIPWDAVISLFIGSIAIWVFGSNLSLTVFGDMFPRWVEEWRPGMNLTLTYQRSQLWVWMSPTIGFAIAAAILPMVLNCKPLIRAIKSLTKLPSSLKSAGYLPLPIIIALYLFGTGGSVLVFKWLVPDFPIWIPLLISVGWSFVNGIVTTRALGETGQIITIPYLWQGAIMLSGYPKIDAWFASPIMGGAGAPYFTSSIKVAYLTNTRPMDWIKAYLFSVPISWISAFFYTQLLWSMAPIPSSVYPYSIITFPVRAITDGLWCSRQLTAFRVELIATGFIGMLAVCGVGEALKILVGLPFNTIGLFTGTLTLPPNSLMIFIGGLMGRFIIPRITGVEWWNKNKTTVVAGLAAGEGVLVGIVSAAVMMAKASWMLPY